jgi:hypothetical protein
MTTRRTQQTHKNGELPLQAALRACAQGIYAAEAGINLLINNRTWLLRKDFTKRFVHLDNSTLDDTALADIDWTAAINALNTGDLPCSGGEQSVLRLAASLADGLPINLRDAVTGIDQRNVELLVAAVFHASGQRQTTHNP